MTTWVLVANAAEAHIYAVENLRMDNLNLVEDFLHPESRQKVTDLVSDKPGHYKTLTNTRGSYAKNNPKEVEAEHFALQLVKALKAGYASKKYANLVAVVPHHFYSCIQSHLNFSLEDVRYIDKDYTKYAMPKLLTTLREQLFAKV